MIVLCCKSWNVIVENLVDTKIANIYSNVNKPKGVSNLDHQKLVHETEFGAAPALVLDATEVIKTLNRYMGHRWWRLCDCFSCSYSSTDGIALEACCAEDLICNKFV
ncbi:hypothetical protein M8C21_001694 [Ambrosia artemisiifolia]|uniref:Uncharacterized protein n=1 Tax=Ambrosia artemisiifolia TaxID=4212 RepID=A0AAD5DHF6_AMBAR|nr:hypothetical protein M8C21_001694 [Ambrosia artemisiifolia]